MSVFKNRLAFELVRGTRALLKVASGVTRDGGTVEAEPGASTPKVSGTAEQTDVQEPREDEKPASQLSTSPEADGITPKNIVWIFGAGRTGSTWLARMMAELEGHTVWFEPWVGALFDPYHLRLEDRKGQHFIFSARYRRIWLKSIRRLVLDGANARFPEAAGASNYLVIKEPGGSVGAVLLMKALPQSRMVLLVRDPRDVVASWNDAHRKGGWQERRREERQRPLVPIEVRAQRYVENVGEAKKAYDSHRGRKVLVRYEEMRADALGTMKRIYSALEIPVDEEQLARAVEKHSWENIPEEEKGEGKFYRKATPGGWREDLTPEQREIVEEITAPLLEEFYPT